MQLFRAAPEAAVVPDDESINFLSPLHNNIIAMFCMVAYFRVALEMVSWVRMRFNLDDGKQMLHMTLASFVVFWPLFDMSHWTWRLNALVPFTIASRLLLKGGIIRYTNDVDVKNFSTTSSPNDLLLGPFQFSVLMTWLGLHQFMEVESVVIASAAAADALAPLIGKQFGHHRYQMPLSNMNTMVVGTVLICYLYLYLMGLSLLPLRLVLAYAGIASIVEANASSHVDNIFIPIALHFAMRKIPDWLGA